jgi:hypothetical protein
MITAKLVTTNNLTLFTGTEQITIPSDSPDYHRAIDLLAMNRSDEAFALATKYRASLKATSSVLFGNYQVSVVHGMVMLNNQPIEGDIVDRIVAFGERGIPQKALMTFLARLQDNPSFRARIDLFSWIEQNNMPITDDGCFIAFKIVKDDYWDIYTGSTFFHKPGSVVQMERRDVDDNADNTCSAGAHFCGEGYLPHYGTARGSRIVTLKIAPEDVVAFPKDYNLAKGRAYKYEVIGEMSREDVANYLGSINRVYIGSEDTEELYTDEDNYEETF